MASVFAFLFLAALVGIVRPPRFIAGSKRWHYGIAAAVLFAGIAITAPADSIENEAPARPGEAPPAAAPGEESPQAEAEAAVPAGPERLSSSREFVWIRANQRLIKGRLKDPDSARFGEDYVSYKIGAPVVCGTVNSRNSFGGYAGAERYIGGGETIGTFLESEASDFDDLWRQVC